MLGDLTILRRPDLLGLAAALIAIACLGKLLGGDLGGLFFGDTAHAIIDSRCCTLLLVKS
jgi:hypothetical protein